MSLLPQQIIPQTVPIGKLNQETGLVSIDQNWWLLFYNLCQVVLGLGGGLPASQITELLGAEADANDSDAIVLRAPIASLAALISTEGDPIPSLADVRNALILGQDSLLSDPIPVAQPAQVITVGGSPFTYTAPFIGNVVITGGTISSIFLLRQGTSVGVGISLGFFPVSRGDQLQVTYTVVPTMTFLQT